MDANERREKALETLGIGGDGKPHRCGSSHRVSAKIQERRNVTRKQEWNICAKKVRYRTQNEAHRAATIAFQRRGVRIFGYYCGICHGYHLTHKARKSGHGNSSGRVF